ncbi:MAG: class II fumarate hydratase [Nitrospirae bacterium]|nr:class II fumarate hydratase [Nitrospirota bacterium]
MKTKYRIEKDTLGEVSVPTDAYWGAQTQRAIENFKISGTRFSLEFIKAVALIKYSAAETNARLGLLKKDLSEAIISACMELLDGGLSDQFPLDIFQTGSGTSTNMNVNEVIATRANELLTGIKSTSSPIHPNDHVNMGQSSNDVIPSAIRIASVLMAKERLIPYLEDLHCCILEKRTEYKDIVKIGRTHLMDAMPVTFGHELSGWATQVKHGIRRVEKSLPSLAELPIGGTAVGTGINTHRMFAKEVVKTLNKLTNVDFTNAANNFEAQAAIDSASEMSGQLKTIAASLMKIANDLRLMNSGPVSGMAEIQLPALQPGSSIMPAKVNPVVPEAVRMVCAKVMGNDTTITISCASGEFELNTMLPVIAHCLLESIDILSGAVNALCSKAIQGMVVNVEHVSDLIEKNPVIATTLVPSIGYEKTAELIKKAIKEKRRIRNIVRESGILTEDEINKYLDINKMIGEE